ncbi:hypothetical protein PIB30_096079, partial [Stylosanthes scabra]|nr:hypothetical protein [Stylosanthes scabra]
MSLPHRRSASVLSPPHYQSFASLSASAPPALYVAFFLRDVFLCLDAGLNKLHRLPSSSPSSK